MLLFSENLFAMFHTDCNIAIRSKHFFIIPTDAHNYKITGMLKTIKIPIIAQTCFCSRRSLHQGLFRA